MQKLLFASLLLMGSLVYANGIDYDKLENQLKGDGLGGWIHGSVSDQGLHVFTWRDPNNFFINAQFPMISEKPAVMDALKKLGRHDYVILKGKFFTDPPIRHIQIDEIVLVEPYEGPGSDDKHKYNAEIPKDLIGKTEMKAKVHAIAAGGKVLVIEYKDVVLPVFNEKPELAKNLYRNDKIDLKFVMAGQPLHPQHLEVAVKEPNPIVVTDAMVKGHGQPIYLEGSLVMFPKSPQIIFNVYALREVDQNGIRRNYTLVNFQDPKLFKAIRQKLEHAWNKYDEYAVYDRNKFINRYLKVKASGIKNVVDPSQANPQILLNDIDDIEVEVQFPPMK